MTHSEVETSRAILYISVIVGAIYGLLFLLMPEWQLELSQDPGACGAHSFQPRCMKRPVV
jgi:hypothetical protein